MSERSPEMHHLTKRGRVWPLVAVLLLALVPWLVTGMALGVGCENREDEQICEATSQTTYVLWLLALEALPVIGWVVARARRSPTTFVVTAVVAVALNVSAAVLVLIWGSGDL